MPEVVQVKNVDGDIPLLDKYVEEVLMHLSDHKSRIGIVGPVGIGKTTVMKKLNNKLKDFEFDIVISVTYPCKEVNAEDKIVEMIQEQIMERLKLRKDHTAITTEQNAYIISEVLFSKKYILLLDQVSFPFDLDKVGIHREHEFGKVVIASRRMNVINKMTDHYVEIKTLSGDEALDLFQKIWGTIHDTRIEPIAKRITESCGGLPQVIILVATYLKNKRDESSLNYVKRRLQSDTPINLLGLGGVCHAYKMAYEELPEDFMRKCSLYGAMFPMEHKICKDYLIECWMAERFIDIKVSQKLRAARDCGVTVLNELTANYLLEWCSNKYVKMPHYFRPVALEKNYLHDENSLIWAPSTNELPDEEMKGTVTKISLIGCDLRLPESPEWSNACTLLLQRNQHLITLPDRFFFHMKTLRVLDLHRTGIQRLPSSVSHLVNLISLYLNGCFDLSELPYELKNLVNVEILDIRGTKIPWLPREIKNMAGLRCLRTSFFQKGFDQNSEGKEIEVMSYLQIISSLKQLEELSIETDLLHSQGWIDIADDIVLEAAGLKQLTTLQFNFTSVNSLREFVTNSKSWNDKSTEWGHNTFRSFKLCIGLFNGTEHSDTSGTLGERHLRFSTNEEVSSVQQVLKQASSFELIDNSKIKTLNECDLKNLGALKVCVIKACNRLHSIVEESDGIILQSLEKLHLVDLHSLQCIWKGPVFPGSIINLTVLTLNGCHGLTEILNHDTAKALSSLKHLKIENCSSVTNIVEIPQEQVDLIDVLNNVEIIELSGLPELLSICCSTSMKWNSLNNIMIIRCSKLGNLSLTLTNATNLVSIECEDSWWNQLKLPDGVKQHLHQHCHFVEETRSPISRPEGETSSNGRSVNHQKSLNGINSVTVTDDRVKMPSDLVHNNGKLAILESSSIPPDEAYKQQIESC